MSTRRNDLVSALSSKLQYLNNLGVEAVPRGDEQTQARGATLEELQAHLEGCTRCGLCAGRTNLVFGVGSPDARLMFVGEGPGADEDRQGEPFVGRAGKLLNKIIAAMGLERRNIYIGNVVKCRPPQNRAPLPDEAATCMPFLLQQIAAIQPEIVVTLGSVATKYLLGDDTIKISRVRGIFQDWNGIKLMPTYHPAFLLRNPKMKKPVWEDMQQVMRVLSTKTRGQ
jgi:uracil-DNA glycosylase